MSFRRALSSPHEPEPVAKPSPGKILRSLLYVVAAAILSLGATGLILGVSAAFFLRDVGHRSETRSQLRVIAEAAVIYAGDHQKRLPEAIDFPDYAFKLAEKGGLRDPYVWLEPGKEPPDDMRTISIPDPDASSKQIPHPALAHLRPQFSVVLGGLRLDQPPTTPVAWTRGLNPGTGKWMPDSPYRGEGGFIAFLDGKIAFVADLHEDGGALRDFKTGKPTASLLDALPPATRLSEPGFPDQLETTWSRIRTAIQAGATTIFPFVFVLIPFWGICLLVYLAMRFEYAWNRRPFVLPRWVNRTLVLTPILALALNIVVRI